MKESEQEKQVKLVIVSISLGMLFGALISLCTVAVILGNFVETAFVIASVITVIFAVVNILLVYLIYFLKTYTVITRKLKERSYDEVMKQVKESYKKKAKKVQETGGSMNDFFQLILEENIEIEKHKEEIKKPKD